MLLSVAANCTAQLKGQLHHILTNQDAAQQIAVHTVPSSSLYVGIHMRLCNLIALLDQIWETGKHNATNHQGQLWVLTVRIVSLHRTAMIAAF